MPDLWPWQVKPALQRVFGQPDDDTARHPAVKPEQQDWRELPCGQSAAVVPQTWPALAAQLPQPGRKPAKAAAAAQSPSLYDFIKPAIKQPPRSAAEVTATFVGLAATGKQVAHHHTTSPGWRAIVQALNAQIDSQGLSAEQAVSIVSAVGIIGAGPNTHTLSTRAAVHLATTVNHAPRTFPASACASFLQGLAVAEASAEAWELAAHAFIGGWLFALWEIDNTRLEGFPAECLGVLRACARFKASPGEYALDRAAELAVKLLEKGQTSVSAKVQPACGAPACSMRLVCLGHRQQQEQLAGVQHISAIGL